MITEAIPQDLKKISDEELLDLSLKRNYDAFEELVRRYEGRVYRLGLKILHSPQDAEDLLQKTFMTVFEKMYQFRGESKVSTWLFRIATNHALMKLRREKGKEIRSLDAPAGAEYDSPKPQLADENTDVSQFFERKELMKQLEEAVNELPEVYRLVFILRDVEGFSNKEVARMLNLSIPAVKSRIFRARLHLKERLSEKIPKEEVP